jgi:hypothetical protein
MSCFFQKFSAGLLAFSYDLSDYGRRMPVDTLGDGHDNDRHQRHPTFGIFVTASARVPLIPPTTAIS